MQIRLNVDGVHISRAEDDTQELVADSRGFITAALTFGPMWDGLRRLLLWKRENLCVSTLGDRETVEIPWEMLTEGSFTVTAVGVSPDGKRRLATLPSAPIQVTASGLTGAEETVEPTPSLYAQLLAAVDTAVARAESAASAAEAAAEMVRAAIAEPNEADEPADEEAGEEA